MTEAQAKRNESATIPMKTDKMRPDEKKRSMVHDEGNPASREATATRKSAMQREKVNAERRRRNVELVVNWDTRLNSTTD